MLADRLRGAGPPPRDAPELGLLLSPAGQGAHAPQSGPAVASSSSQVADDDGAFDLLLNSLAASLAARRRELAAELLHVRAVIAAEVLAANEKAASLVQAACTDLADALSPSSTRSRDPEGPTDPGPARDEPPVEAAPAPARPAEPVTRPAPSTGTPSSPAPPVAGRARYTPFGDPSVLGSMPAPPARRRPGRLRSPVHLDTLLPLVAVLILLVVLVAWIG